MAEQTKPPISDQLPAITTPLQVQAHRDRLVIVLLSLLAVVGGARLHAWIVIAVLLVVLQAPVTRLIDRASRRLLP